MKDISITSDKHEYGAKVRLSSPSIGKISPLHFFHAQIVEYKQFFKQRLSTGVTWLHLYRVSRVDTHLCHVTCGIPILCLCNKETSLRLSLHLAEIGRAHV